MDDHCVKIQEIIEKLRNGKWDPLDAYYNVIDIVFHDMSIQEWNSCSIIFLNFILENCVPNLIHLPRSLCERAIEYNELRLTNSRKPFIDNLFSYMAKQGVVQSEFNRTKYDTEWKRTKPCLTSVPFDFQIECNVQNVVSVASFLLLTFPKNTSFYNLLIEKRIQKCARTIAEYNVAKGFITTMENWFLATQNTRCFYIIAYGIVHFETMLHKDYFCNLNNLDPYKEEENSPFGTQFEQSQLSQLDNVIVSKEIRVLDEKEEALQLIQEIESQFNTFIKETTIKITQLKNILINKNKQQVGKKRKLNE